MSNTARPVILCIDDDQDIRALYRHHLDGDYTVITASSGKEGLGIVSQQQPDLVLMDVLMPEMDGYQTCERLQQQESTAYLPVVFVSVLGQEEDVARAYAVGGVDYLKKPFAKEKLMAVIDKHLKTGDAWKQKMEYVPQPIPEAAKKDVSFQQYLSEQMELPEDKAESLLKADLTNIYTAAAAIDVAEHLVAQTIARYKKLPYIEFINPNSLLLGLLPAPFSRGNNVVAFRDNAGKDAIVLSNPLDMVLQDSLENALEPSILSNVYVAEPSSIKDLFQKHYVPYIIDRTVTLAVRKKMPVIDLWPTASWFKIRLSNDKNNYEMAQLTHDTGIKLVSRFKVMGGMMGHSLHKEIMQGAYSHVVDGSQYALQLSCRATEHGEALAVQVADLVSGQKSAEDEKPSAPLIMIVDDDNEHNQLLERILAKAGYSIVSVVDGIEALLELGRKDYTLVLADLNMPNLDGMKLLEFVQQKNIQVPVVLISATSDSKTIEEAYAKGAVGYVTKPITPVDFRERIERILNRR